MKAHLRIFALATLLLAFINIGKAQETEDETYKKILTPLGHQPDNSNLVHETIWTDDEVEHCKQVWLYGGGVFKLESGSFKEKNNYLDNHKVLCMALDENNIYIGTEYGIYLSTDLGISWLSKDNDGINNLPDRKINALLIGMDRIFAGTDNGLWISTNSGEDWEQKLENKNITCIEFGDGNDVYAGAEGAGSGIFKSTNSGVEWLTKHSANTFCLLFNSGNFYAGIEAGLLKSTNGGNNWQPLLFDLDKVLSIFIDGNNIYIGTYSLGFYYSTNGSPFYSANTNLPTKQNGEWYSIKSIKKYDSKLYIAYSYPINGLYWTYLTNINWDYKVVYESGANYERIINQIYIHNNQGTPEFWLACYGGKWYESAEMITDKESPFDPPNFPGYNCHSYAWHMTEGGPNVSRVGLNDPNYMNYIPNNQSETNWDYIRCYWHDPDMEKVFYSNQYHSGIKSSKNDPEITLGEDLIIESIWMADGPLVEHKLSDCPYATNDTTFWKSKKEVEGDITIDQFIVREIYTKKETSVISTRIPNGSTVDMYVAPMNNHQIHLQSGFHAEKGCNFHAYVKDYYLDNEEKKPCKMPWEEEASKSEDYLTINETGYSFERQADLFTLNNNKEKPKIKFDTIPCRYEDKTFNFSGKGSGTKEDPFQITNIYQFEEIREDWGGDHYWILMNDIDASETRYCNPYINNDGDTLFYQGFFALLGSQIREIDGRGFIVKNLYSFCYKPLILSPNCFTLKRIGFEDLYFSCFNNNIDLIIMSSEQLDFVMEECYFTGMIEDSNTYQYFYGTRGLGGFKNNTIVRNCYVDLVIKSKTDSSITHFGNLYSMYPESKIENCYATGQAISARIKSPFGYEGNVQSCFWDSDKIKVNQGLGKGTELPTSEMMKRSTFEYAGWDFENVWYIEEGKDYPKLRAFKRETEVKEEPAIEDFELSLHKVPNSNLYEIEYSVPHPCQLELKVINSMGQVVSVLSENPFHREGRYRTTFDGSSHSSGVYLIVLSTANNIIYRKLMVVR